MQMRESGPFKIREYLTENGESPFRLWLESLATAFKARIQARLLRLELGNLGDHKSLGDGVYELRLDFGPGFRVYYGLDGKKLVLLLWRGDKSSQRRDITKAKDYWQQYLKGK
jgi:putative addiction module killer protein